MRLASKLTSWNIDVLSESEYAQLKLKEADKSFQEGFPNET